MPCEVTHDAERDYIVTQIDGRLDVSVVKEFLAELGRVMSTSGCERVLVDLRGAAMRLSMGELYFAPRMVSEAGIPIATKRAVIVAEKDWSLYSYLQMVAQNQAQIVRIFTDPDEASRWLMR